MKKLPIEEIAYALCGLDKEELTGAEEHIFAILKQYDLVKFGEFGVVFMPPRR